MQRVIAIIALIFAFASLAGATTAHAHRYVSTPIVVLNHVDEQNVPIPIFVVVQRGEIDLGAGIVMPCGPHHGIPVSGPTLPSAPQCAEPTASLAKPLGQHSGHPPMRPPIAI